MTKKKEPKQIIDLEEKIKVTRWQFIQIMLVCSAFGAGATLLNALLGLVVVGGVIIVLAFPLILKVWEGSTK